jgi:hypothetical protein
MVVLVARSFTKVDIAIQVAAPYIAMWVSGVHGVNAQKRVPVDGNPEKGLY